jgi:CRP-like cAMP-binding protein
LGLLCPHKFKAYKGTHDFGAYKKGDYIYFEEDTADKIYLSEKDIATLKGISRPMLNILLNDLKENDIIDFNRKQLIIYNKIA